MGVGLGAALRGCRERSGFAVGELSRRSGVDVDYIKRLELGGAVGPDGTHLWALIAALEVSADSLLLRAHPNAIRRRP